MLLGIIIIANLVDPFKAPGYAMLNSNENDDLDVSSIISQINSVRWQALTVDICNLGLWPST